MHKRKHIIIVLFLKKKKKDFEVMQYQRFLTPPLNFATFSYKNSPGTQAPSCCIWRLLLKTLQLLLTACLYEKMLTPSLYSHYSTWSKSHLLFHLSISAQTMHFSHTNLLFQFFEDPSTQLWAFTWALPKFRILTSPPTSQLGLIFIYSNLNLDITWCFLWYPSPPPPLRLD